MSQQPEKPGGVQWYTVSLSSVRRVVTLLAVVSGLIGGFLLLQRWEHRELRERAEAAIAEATDLTRRVERRGDYEQIRIEHFSAWEELEVARSEVADERYREALERAQRSLEELREVLQIDQGPQEGKGRFVSVQGGVEYRRGERGAWKRARTATTALNPGDWVKTSSDGTAEIRLPDGSKYVLRRNTMVRLGSSRNLLTGTEVPVTDIAFGWVDINTSRRSSKVKTPKAEAEVRKNSKGQVEFHPEQGSGRLAVFEGSGEIVSQGGQTRQVGALQQVEQIGDLLSAPKPLPSQPQLAPAGRRPAGRPRHRAQPRLAWTAVDRLRPLRPQRLPQPDVRPNIISEDNRRKTSAKLGLRGEGIFYWQVAAIDRDGVPGSLERAPVLPGRGARARRRHRRHDPAGARDRRSPGLRQPGDRQRPDRGGGDGDDQRRAGFGPGRRLVLARRSR